jgi:choline dehydrogenase-like flavoprotein
MGNCTATRLISDENGRIRAVECIDNSRDVSERRRVVAKVFILAANAIETAKLWLYSRLRNRSGQVGLNLMDHPARDVVFYYPEPVYPFRGPQNTSGIEAYRDGPFRKEHAAFRISVGNDGWGRTKHPFSVVHELLHASGDGLLLGKALRARIAETVSRMGRLSYAVEMLPDSQNKVSLSSRTDALGLPVPSISFSVGSYALDGLRVGGDVVTEIARAIPGASGIRAVIPPFGFHGSGHLMGTLRMAGSPERGVVDAFGNAFEHPNLYVCGASVFVTGAAANPTLTVAALALRTAQHIAEGL